MNSSITAKPIPPRTFVSHAPRVGRQAMGPVHKSHCCRHHLPHNPTVVPLLVLPRSRPGLDIRSSSRVSVQHMPHQPTRPNNNSSTQATRLKGRLKGRLKITKVIPRSSPVTPRSTHPSSRGLTPRKALRSQTNLLLPSSPSTTLPKDTRHHRAHINSKATRVATSSSSQSSLWCVPICCCSSTLVPYSCVFVLSLFFSFFSSFSYAWLLWAG